LITSFINWARRIGLKPRIAYVGPPGAQDRFLQLRSFTEWSFKLVGWIAVLASLHFAYLKTQHVSFRIVELSLQGIMLITLMVFLNHKFKIQLVEHDELPNAWKKILHAVLIGAPVGLLYVYISGWIQQLVYDISQMQLTACH
jgi:c-di-AMP phosphodiesterase-like protein